MSADTLLDQLNKSKIDLAVGPFVHSDVPDDIVALALVVSSSSITCLDDQMDKTTNNDVLKKTGNRDEVVKSSGH